MKIFQVIFACIFCTHIVSVAGSENSLGSPLRTIKSQSKHPTTSKTNTRIGRHNQRVASNIPSGGGKGIMQNACAESDTTIALKTVVLAALEAATLLGVLVGSDALSFLAARQFQLLEKFEIPSIIGGLSVIQWVAMVFVIFSSSTVKTWIQGGVSTATNQLLKPDVVPGSPEWYSSLKKPWFNPPGWLFPVMWLIVSKPTQLTAVSKILKSDVSSKYWPVLAVYCTHLSLGDAWNEVFFGCQRIGLGAVVICAFFGFLLTSARLFHSIDVPAGYFMLPTCAWVFVATALNLSIYVQNK